MRIPAWLWLGLVGLLAAVGDLVFRGTTGDLLYDVPALLAAAVCIHTARRQAHTRASWLLLAAGTSLFVAADLMFSFVSSGFPGPADVVYLAAYPFYAAGGWPP